MPKWGRKPVIAIIGGGLTGAAIALHLDRLTDVDTAAIVVIEPRSALGAGLAYATDDPIHRINVPAARMSLDPERPDAFEVWLAANGEGEADPEALLADGRWFPRRATFGRYVADALAPALSARRVLHRRALATRVDVTGHGYRILLSDRTMLDADLLVIATTHPPPMVPPLFAAALPGDPRLIRDPTRQGALDGIAADERILIVGTGLTMADIVATLDAQGHRGSIMAFSRRGQLSAPHPLTPVAPFGDFVKIPARSARQLVRSIRNAVAAAAEDGVPSQAVFDALRAQGRAIWWALPVAERRRVVRHLRVFWDARRFRIAPQVHAVIERRRNLGLFSSLAGRARRVTVDQRGITVTLALRQEPRNQTIGCDRVIVATGPAHAGLLASVPYLASLADAGLLVPDEVGLGLATDIHGRAIGKDGTARNTLLIGGPLARGTFGELMGLPEVTNYAVELAHVIASWMNAQRAVPFPRLRA